MTATTLRYRLLAIVPDSALTTALDRLDEILDPATDTVSWFEAGKQLWRIEALTAREPDADSVAAIFAGGLKSAAVPFTIEPLPEIDWLAENRKSFKPVVAGRFFVHPGDWDGGIPRGAVAIELDAGLAFGSGTHETTRGCLLTIDRLAGRGGIGRAVDLGCGSGILAIALARVTRKPVAAADIDPVAVRVADENARLNGVGALVRPVVSAGWQHGALRAGPYDLVVANILAGPLIRMAAQTVHRMAPGGSAILSGLMRHQEPPVLAAYRRAGLKLTRIVRLGEWSTLLCRKPE